MMMGGENGGLVELVGLVLWWVGDKEMMVLGSRCGLFARSGEGGLEMGLNLLREMLMMLVRELIECRRCMLVGLDLEGMMDLENYGLQKGGRRIFGWTGAV